MLSTGYGARAERMRSLTTVRFSETSAMSVVRHGGADFHTALSHYGRFLLDPEARLRGLFARGFDTTK